MLIQPKSFLKLIYPKAVWKIKTSEKIIHLTFDDGPIPGLTEWVLDELKKFSAKATFFCVGENVKKNPDIFSEIIRRNHSVGNHTFNHMNGWKSEPEDYFGNVAKCSDYFNTTLFRPPYGKLDCHLAKVAAHQGMCVVDWTICGGDNPRLTAAEVYAKAQRECSDLGLTTVYRTLEILEQLGAIRRVHLEDGCEAFAPTALEHGHYVICHSCQATIEFEGCDLTRLLNRVANQTGFVIEQHWLELVGRCPKCQKKLHSKSSS